MNRNIPGTIEVVGREFCYVSDDGKDDFEDSLFDKVTSQCKVPIAQHGGVISENCRLWLPTDELFHGLSYKGDIDGWRKEIEVGANILGLSTAKIIDGNIELSDGRTFPLSKCRIEFY